MARRATVGAGKLAFRMNIAVIGAGATGLTAAWELANAGHRVTLFEAHEQVGGLAAGFRLPNWDWWLDKFYHHWFSTDTDVLRLVDEIGCSRKVIFSEPQSRYWIDGNLYDLSVSSEALRLPVWQIGKLRLVLAGFYLKLPHRWTSLDHIPAYDWLHRVMGNEVYSKIWASLLEGKFKDTYRKIPLSWLWAHIYNRSSSIAIYEGGFQALWENLAQLLKARGVEIFLNTPITRLSIQDGKPMLLAQDKTAMFDIAISTLSPPIMLKIAPDLASSDYAKQVLTLKNVAAVCLVLALSQPLFTDGSYALTLPSENSIPNGFPFINIYEHTNLVSRSHYGGDHLVYCVDYVSPDHATFQMSDAEILTWFIGALPRLNANFSGNWIRDSWVFKAAAGQPIPELNAGKQIPNIKTPLPGVYWITMNQMHPWGKGTNFAVRLGKEAANMILRFT